MTLFDLVNKRVTKSISLRNTNVLVNHKHYRYVKTLWIELDKVKPEKSESEKLKFEQDVINGLRAYAKSLISYSLKSNLQFEIHGNYSTFNAKHLQLCDLSFNESDKGIFEIKIGEKKMSIIVIGNLPEYDDKLLALLKTQNTYILYFDENKTIESSRIIHINPLDPDSVERVGSLIRKYLLFAYLKNIEKQYEFKHLLLEYAKYLPTDFIETDRQNFSYKFHSYPKTKLSFEEIKDKIENDNKYKLKSRPDREEILNCLTELLNDIESNTARLENEYLKCFNCGEKLHSRNIDKLNYIKCTVCSCLIDSSHLNKISFKISDNKYINLTPKEFGMDNLSFDMDEKGMF